MSSSSTESDMIPQYIRYKAEDKRGDDYWDDEIERVNTIVYERVQRVQQDKLCTGCARFDWLRTQFYTHEVVRKDGKSPARVNVIPLDEQRAIGRLCTQDTFLPDDRLDELQDNVSWLDFEPTSELPPGLRELMKHPDFEWEIVSSRFQPCALCQSLTTHWQASHFLQQPITYLRIRCSRGPLLEEGEGHHCLLGVQSNLTTEIQQTNAIVFKVVPASEGSGLQAWCHMRPITNGSGTFSSDVPHLCITSRLLGCNVDLSLLAGWLKTCDNDHKHEMSLSAERMDELLTGFRLIDINQQCVVRSSVDVPFAALSYTWGSNEQFCLSQRNEKALGQPGILESISSLLRPTILDSMQVCRALRIPYLWIDSLCIIQDDVVGKHQQIQNMNRIYGNAYLTIVAASSMRLSVDDSCGSQASLLGLAGVSAPRLPSQILISIEEIDYSITAGDSLESLDVVLGASHWFSRGWTFQELVLSRRMLVFTANEAFFHCQNGLLSESTCLSSNTNQSLPLQCINNIRLCNFLHRELPRQYAVPMSIDACYMQYKSIYLPLLEAYLKRILSFDSDILDAFSGITSALETVLGGFHGGLPTCVLARALLLGFPHSKGIRDGFPSWSWLGKRIEKRSMRFSPLTDISGCDTLIAMVHIYAYDENAKLKLMLGPRNYAQGIEGYSSAFIKVFNRTTLLDPLPLLPSIEENYIHHGSSQNTMQLIFWTQVAWLLNDSEMWFDQIISNRFRFDFPNLPETFEVILIAAQFHNAGEEITESLDEAKFAEGVFKERSVWYQGIIIERHEGFARRIGVATGISREVWLAGKPRKELIVLI